MNETPLWASESFWKKTAIWVTAGSFLILVVLTMDSLSKTSAGSKRVPAYAVINKKIDYQYNKELHKSMPVIGENEFLFGKEYSLMGRSDLGSAGRRDYGLVADEAVGRQTQNHPNLAVY